MHFIIYILIAFNAAVFAQVDLVKQQAEINSAKADLENARQERDMAVAKRWQEKSKQNELRETIEQQLEARKEKTEGIFATRSRLYEEMRIAREALEFANEDLGKARAAFLAVESPVLAADTAFSNAKKSIEYNAQTEISDSLVRLGPLGMFPIKDSSAEFILVEVDPLLNKNLIATAEEGWNFKQFMQDGGILMYPILAMFAVAMILILERIIVLIASRRYYKQIKAVVETQTNRADAEKSMEALFAKIVPALESRLSAISVLGTTAPLLGLLGTVMGMIELFNVITMHGTADPKLLAGGISIALITTEAGLSVAIPVHLLHTWIAGRVEKAISKMEYFAMNLINEKYK